MQGSDARQGDNDMFGLTQQTQALDAMYEARAMLFYAVLVAIEVRDIAGIPTLLSDFQRAAMNYGRVSA
jgi:hypothetical protein